ncbi:4Fe-4S dicluster domain-containing protein [Geoanaerobacter pelophilus]|uniref:4Fe-4S dicluster domain-containing protein n=1 Tax=Geoanaerobacter pelophilus TaxID=60036 RepID=UPI000A2716C7|nr:4Fe-4S dicluster domain-containing protein [Geoanaerobacter pelophilus]
MKHRVKPQGRLAPWREGVQWLVSLLLLTIPFLQAGGQSLLRLDAGSRTLLFFGANLRIEEFYLFLIVVLILVFGFLFVTMHFGRVWCGWLCPQTTLCDLADWADARLGGLKPAPWQRLARHISYLALSALVASNLVWYFIAPPQFIQRLASGDIGAVAGITLASVLLLVYLDLAFVRRSFCKSVCPYGRIQLMTMERGTLTLEFDPARKDACLRCGACVRACPMGIDIRDGLQVECINCGRCLDACREVMGKRGGKGLIRYSFGNAPGEPVRLNRKAIILGALLLLLATLLAFGVAGRKEATLKLQRAAGAQVKLLPDGSLVNFYTVYLENRTTRAGAFSLEAAPLPGRRVELIGPVQGLRIPGNANRKVDLALKVNPAPAGALTGELRLVSEGRVLAATPLPVAVE